MNLLTILTPINLLEEKGRFFESADYHPVFKYKWEAEPIEIEAFRPGKRELAKAIFDQDRDRIVNLAEKHFETNLTDYKKEAEKVIKNYNHQALPDFSLEELKEEFEAALKFFNLDYNVKIVDQAGFNIRPRTSKKEILISKHTSWQYFDPEGEVKHEMVHVIRYENNKYNKIAHSSNYLPTEEGLATYMQDTSTNGKSSEFQHAAEYVASSIGVKGSLRQIYDYFKSVGFNDELAWYRAARHKFGFKKTSQPGDIIKPAMYHYYSREVKSLNKDEIMRLFIGKISIQDLPKYKQYTGIIEQRKITKFFKLNK